MTSRIDLASKAFAAAQSRLQECRVQINEFASADETLDDRERDEVLESVSDRLSSVTIRAKDAVRLVLELVELPGATAAFDEGWVKESAGIGTVDYIDEFIGPYSPPVDFLNYQADLLRPLFSVPNEVDEQRSVLDRMLRQTPHYLEETKQLPAREKDIQDSLEPVLGLAFPDLIREAATPKQTKTYFPDFGIESIQTAIEVKYVKNRGDAPKTLGSLYEDMKGYAASQFDLFLAVVYMTGNYLTEEQVRAEWKKVGVPKSWRVYLLFVRESAALKPAKTSTTAEGIAPAAPDAEGQATPEPRRRKRRGQRNADEGQEPGSA